jgi:hypothetical protein
VRGRIELAPGKPRLYTSGPRGLARECAVGLRPEPQHPELCCSAPSRRALVGLHLGNTRALPAVTTCAARHVPGHKPERGSSAAVGPLPRPIAATAPREWEPREATNFQRVRSIKSR